MKARDERAFWDEAFRFLPREHVEVSDQILDPELAGLAPGTALDLGCGAGTNAIKLAGQGWRVMGVDWSPTAVAMAQAAAAERGLPVTFVEADIAAWKPAASFDLVTCTFALSGRNGHFEILQNASAALAPGGTLIVAEWDPSMAERWEWEDGALQDAEELASLLTGLEIEKTEVRHLERVFASDDLRAKTGTWANVALVRARRFLDAE